MKLSIFVLFGTLLLGLGEGAMAQLEQQEGAGDGHSLFLRGSTSNNVDEDSHPLFEQQEHRDLAGARCHKRSTRRQCKKAKRACYWNRYTKRCITRMRVISPTPTGSLVCADQPNKYACRKTSGCFWDLTALTCIERIVASTFTTPTATGETTTTTTTATATTTTTTTTTTAATLGTTTTTTTERPNGIITAACADQLTVEDCRTTSGCFWDIPNLTCIDRPV